MAKPKPFTFLQGLLVLIVGGALLFLGWYAVSAPWIYTVGRLRYIPIWQGMASAQGPGGEYRIYVSFSPEDGPQVVSSTWVGGFGYVCAPSGHSYSVRVGGGSDSMIWRDMNNRPFGLFTRGPTSVAHILAEAGLPPELEFRGRWQGDEIVAKDDGTISTAFLTDGSLNPKAKINKLDATQQVTFREMFWGFTNPCR